MYKRNVITNKDVVPFELPVFEEMSGEHTSPSPSVSAEKIERQAYEKGFEAGERAGFEMGQAKVKTLVEKIEDVLREIIRFKDSLVTEVQPMVIELAVAMAERIVMKTIDEHPEQIVEITKEAFTRLQRTKVTIRIHPSLKGVFEAHAPEMFHLHPEIAFETDPSLGLYEAKIEGEFEEVHFDIHEEIKTLIREMLERRTDD